MVGDNKILTVSYGTFSCTLEGFDDPFSTMKNIAEYFRDLAAGDRFFGAEPPQPDPEMLQNIAEQTIQARVNAQLSDNGMVLRQSDVSGVAPMTTPMAAPVAAVAAAAVTPHLSPHLSPAAPASTPGVETVAEKLQRIRAVVSRETAQDALFSEDQHVDEFAADTTAPLNVPQNVSTKTVETPVVEDAAPAIEPIADTPSDNFDAPSNETPADEFEQDGVQEDASQEKPSTPEAYDEDLTNDEIDLKSIVGLSKADDANTGETVVPLADDVAEDVVVEEETAPEDTAPEETGLEENTPEETAADDTLDAASREEAAETAIDNVLGKVSDDSAPDEAAPRRRIVVQKIRREDLGNAPEGVSDDMSEDASDDTGDNTVADAAELPPEQEEDLLRELAALQIVDADDAADTSDEISLVEDDDLSDALSDLISNEAEDHEKEELHAAREMRRARRDAITEDDEDDVERLINTTSSRLDSDESSQRRASIAHLKAAVAATKADASLTEAAQEHEARERDQYAEDLARVVRPERKVATGERGKTSRPAPLVLVSELRIDKDDASSVDESPAKDDSPVRPRRVNRAELDDQDTEADAETDAGQNIFSDPDQASFADYAASANALELPDLLEAAAAYYTYVESTEQFTRPMLMRKIASISARDGFSREAGLRSFGTLLREGKLVKGSDGKFVIAKTSRFTPEARYAGE